LEHAVRFPAVRFPEEVKADLQRLAHVSKWLCKEMKFAFDGDVDFIPTEECSKEDAERAREDARFVVAVAEKVMPADWCHLGASASSFSGALPPLGPLRVGSHQAGPRATLLW
jgi:hypothetical protein